MALRTRAGVVLFLVIGVLFVVGMLFFFQATHSVHFRQSTNHVLDDDIAVQIARSCGAVYWAFLEDCLKEQTGCPGLYPTGGGAGTSKLAPGAWGTLNGFVLDRGDFDDQAKLDASVQKVTDLFPGLGAVSMAGTWKVWQTAGEYLYGQIELKVEFVMNRNNYSFVLPCDFKVVQTLPKVVSKFTLFVKESSPDPHYYNKISKSFDAPAPSQKPLILYNTSKAFVSTETDAWRKSGWIFLGGAHQIINLDGTHPFRPASEYFIFWPGFVANPSSELPNACSGFLLNAVDGTSDQFRVRTTPMGAHSDWVNNPGLRALVGDPIAPAVQNSSVIHLFGDKDRKTPTKVFGNVEANFTLVGTLIEDRNSDSVADDVPFASGWTPASFRLPRLADPAAFNVPISPVLVNRSSFDFHVNGMYIGYPQLTALMPQFNSGGATDYITYMTKVWAYDMGTTSKAFNTLYDLLFEGCAGTGGTRQFPPPTHQLGAADYPDRGQTFVLPTDQTGGGSQFSGDLSALDLGAVYADQKFFSHQYANGAEFLDQLPSQGSGKLLDRPQAAFIQGDLDLPALKTECAAVIVTSGKVKVAAVQRTPAGRLTIVALGGNIEVVSGSRLEGVSLVAPAGTVTWGSAFQLEGTLAAKTLDPTAIANNGGEVVYDLRMDPTNPEANLKGVAVILGPKDAGPLKSL